MVGKMLNFIQNGYFFEKNVEKVSKLSTYALQKQNEIKYKVIIYNFLTYPTFQKFHFRATQQFSFFALWNAG